MFKLLKEKSVTKNSISAQLPFRNKGETDTIQDTQKLTGFVVSRPTSGEIPKEIIEKASDLR